MLFRSVVWLKQTTPDLWEVLPKNFEIRDKDILINFEIPYNLNPGDTINDIFIFYGNRLMAGISPIIKNDISIWPNYITFDNHSNFDDLILSEPNTQISRLSYTEDGVHWKDYRSEIRHAKMTFAFWGPKVRVYAVVGPEYGIAEIQIDEGDWKQYDTYNSELSPIVFDNLEELGNDNIIFTSEDLGEGEHTIRIRVSGEKNPSSSNTFLQILKLEYRLHSQAYDVFEEQNERLFWGASYGGKV